MENFKVGDIVQLNPNVNWNTKYREQLLKAKMRITKIDSCGYWLKVIEGEFPDKKKRHLCISPDQLIKITWRIA